MVTQARLKELLSYDEETGVFCWVKPRKRVRVGTPVSCLSRGYVVVRLDGVLYRAHRLAWLWVYGVMPEKEVDHINRNRADNRISNLRLVSSTENKHNTGLRKNNRSGCSGVYFNNYHGCWDARIRVDGRRINLGRYTSLDDAKRARLLAEEIYHPHKTSAEKRIKEESDV